MLLLGLGIVAAIIMVLSWPTWSLVPGANLDQSWQLGLAWGAQTGLQWGTDVVFTFGPLGFMYAPMAFSWAQVFLASALHLVAIFSAVGFAYSIARRRAGLRTWWALAAAAVVVWGSILFLPAIFVALLLGSVALMFSRSWLPLIVVGIGLGIMSHMKLSEAAMVIGFATICTFGARGIRGVLVLASTAGLVSLASWIVAGQSVENVIPWIQNAWEVVRGYASAMSLEAEGTGWHYAVAAALALATIGLAWHSGEGLTRGRRVSLLAATLWLLWLAARGGFTRHDAHVLLFFAVEICLALILALTALRWSGRLLGVAVVTVAFASMVAIQVSPLTPVERTAHAQSFKRTVHALASNDFRAALMAQATRSLRRKHAIEPAIKATLSTDAALADPVDISALWAARPRTWDPLPTLQNYSAYTPSLDRLNGTDIAAAPRAVLRQALSGAIDGRHSLWETPSYQQHVYCTYEVVERSQRWHVLKPSGQDICGEPEEIMRVAVEADQVVAVPGQPDEMTMVTIDLEESLLDRIVSLLFKPEAITIRYGPEEWRYAHGDRANRLMLNIPVRHPSFPHLPISPYESLAVSHPATLTFGSATVNRFDEDDDTVDISDLRVVIAEPGGDSQVPLQVLSTHDVTVRSVDDWCVEVAPSGPDPQVSMVLPRGSGIGVESPTSGPYQVFLSVGDPYSEVESIRLPSQADPHVFHLPLDVEVEASLRVDPPLGTSTKMCATKVSDLPDQD